jgi:carboxyl-terminal processing protease
MHKNIYPFYFSLAVALGIMLGYLLAVNSRSSDQGIWSQNKVDKLKLVQELIYQNYVDTVDTGMIVEAGINGMMGHLDPHSQYVPKQDFHEMNDPLLGSFEGIGIQFQIVEDTLHVIHVIKNGPSEKAGLLDGDRITYVDDSLIAGVGLSNDDVIRLLKGPKETKVKLGIHRLGVDKILEYVITRDKIPTYSIDVAFEKEGVGFIKLSSFTSSTTDEFHQALIKLKRNGIHSLIIDLRNNTGGYLSAATALADELLPEGRMIVYTQGLHRRKHEYHSTAGGLWEKRNLIVLMNENSASASEILSGAIQDNDRGLIMGTRSFGKGLVQENMMLPDGSSLRLTIAKYYTPSGRCIQRPYNSLDGFEKYYYEPYTSDSLLSKDSTEFHTLNGRIVYGGGGILPDSIVTPNYDSSLTAYYQLIRKGIMYNFALKYVDENRSVLKQNWSGDRFVKQFQVEKVVFSKFLDYIKNSGLKLSNEDIFHSKQKIEYMLKAYIGRDLYGDEVFYPVYLEGDEIFQKAMETIKQKY